MKYCSHKLPKHIAIIMDGNGRWAKKLNKPRIWGHRNGAKTVDIITKECCRLGISQLTLYAFSYENWQRPKEEIKYLMTLLKRFLIKERKIIMKNNIRFNCIGKLDKLPNSVLKEIETTKAISANNTGMTLCLALSYGGRVEIVDMVKSIAGKVASGDIDIGDIDTKICEKNMYQPDMPELDLLIRTGGEMRLSNFLLWQVSYSELWVTQVLWPDFREKHLHDAIDSFFSRQRRFGKVIEEKKEIIPSITAEVCHQTV